LAIQEAHRKGIIHRDLKPANIMINKAGEPVVMDFGLAKKSTKVGENVTPVDGTSGTPAYMAPEQFSGNSFDRAELSDQYSIGVVFYQLICGKLPFEAVTLVNLISKINYENPTKPSFVNPEVDEKIEKICLKSFNKNPDLRYLNLKELVVDLNEYLKGDPSTQTARPSAELSRQTAGEIRVSQMLGGRSMEIASRFLADARDQSLFQPIKKKKKKKKDVWVRSLLGYGSLSFLIVLVLIVFYKNRSYFGIGTNSNTISVEANKNNDGPKTNSLKPNREVDISLLLVSPFSEAKAKEAQKEAAKRLQTEVETNADLGKEINLDMVLIPAGKFLMGSPVSEKGRSKDETQHEVTITKPYYIGKYEVTQEQWESVMGNNPSEIKGAKFPVTNVTWLDCKEFIKKLNEKNTGEYRLPTEAEWEYACRAGTTTAYSVGESITKDDANWGAVKPDSIKVVRSYKENAFGLYGMHGNVWEWCEDWYGDYPAGPGTDPKGSAISESHVLRGGSFDAKALFSRSSSRGRLSQVSRYDGYGFRLAKTVNIKIGGNPEIPKPDPTEIMPATVNLLVAPFTKAKAKEMQKEVAKNLQTEVEKAFDLGKGINIDMVLIPAGKFMMGSPASEKGRKDNETQHEVTITKPFYMGKYEVTQEQWQAVMGSNPSSVKGARLPVTNVSWNDCQDFIMKLNARRNGFYRLLTEAEWEYVCRAGTSTAYSYGDTITKGDANWGAKQVPESIKVVGNYKANAFGLFDMHGNVWEWCEDWYAKYPDGAVMDPKGPAKGEDRVLRGGSFNNLVSGARSSNRNGFTPAGRSYNDGFRLVRTTNIKTGASPTAPKPDPTVVKPATEDLLVSPFTEAKAKEVQKSVAKNLQTEVEEKADLGKGVKLDLVLIPAGKFVMGSPTTEKGRNENEKQHEVTLKKPYYMGKYEVTQEQWEAVMGNNPSVIKKVKLPVTNVSWLDCQEFIKKLNEKTNGGYRLPTEAEWEYACRAGTTTVYSFGENITKDDANWGAAQLPESIKVVGNYKANAFGLFDMHGNVWEWCEDFKSDYLAEAVIDPKGPATGTNRVLRGGSFNNADSFARSSHRNVTTVQTNRSERSSFRLAKNP
jgi:formylglycine-generating enzyme required for sulfatase activity